MYLINMNCSRSVRRTSKNKPSIWLGDCSIGVPAVNHAEWNGFAEYNGTDRIGGYSNSHFPIGLRFLALACPRSHLISIFLFPLFVSSDVAPCFLRLDLDLLQFYKAY
jgi:hypothetical protein